MTISDAIHILLTKIVDEGGRPFVLDCTQNHYEAWGRTKVQEAVVAPGPGIPLKEAFKRLINENSQALEVLIWPQA